MNRQPRRHSPLGSRLPKRQARQPLSGELFERTLAREAVRSERTGEVLSMMVLDTSRARPEDLENLLDFLQARLRLTDEIGWLQDQRFAVLLPATTSPEAALVAAAVADGLGAAQSRIGWRLLSSDRDADLLERAAGPDENPPPPPAPPRIGPRLAPPPASPRRLQAEPLAPLFLVPLPRGKRALDVAGSLLLLILLAPLLALTALAIRLDSPGPVLFRQKRVGQGGRIFTLLKFRTMVRNAEELLVDLKQDNERDGPTFKIRGDPRITRIGRLIRGNAIDELPQLWNVLLGDMTLVGPRPPLPREVEHYEPWQAARLRMVGGLTCIWQVDGRLRNVSFADWMRQDIRYSSQTSVRRDLSLMARTAWVVLSKRGDR